MGRYMTLFDNYILAALNDSVLKAYFSGFLVTFSEFFGADWWVIESLFLVIFVDFILGITYALKTRHSLDGTKLHEGLVKFLVYIIFIILAWYLDQLTAYILHIHVPVLAFLAGYQALTEVKSISKHLSHFGFKMPAVLNRAFTLTEQKLDHNLETAFENLSVDGSEYREGRYPAHQHKSSETRSKLSHDF